MTTQLSHIIRLCVLTVLSITLLNSTVWGLDWKIYPGSMCTDVLGPGRTDSQGQTYLRYRFDGSVSNKGNQNPSGPQENIGPFLEVTCPIVRDEIKGTGGGVNRIYIFVTNNDPNNVFSCTSYEKVMGLDVSVQKTSSAPFGPYTGSIDANPPLLDIEETPYKFAYFKCQIPNPTEYGESIIHSYKVLDTDIDK